MKSYVLFLFWNMLLCIVICLPELYDQDIAFMGLPMLQKFGIYCLKYLNDYTLGLPCNGQLVKYR